jgi:hypothetical protein
MYTFGADLFYSLFPQVESFLVQCLLWKSGEKLPKMQHTDFSVTYAIRASGRLHSGTVKIMVYLFIILEILVVY